MVPPEAFSISAAQACVAGTSGWAGGTHSEIFRLTVLSCANAGAAPKAASVADTANSRATRLKLLVHDGFGVWCAARRLNSGRFVWPREVDSARPLVLTQAQFDALVLGLPWQRLPEMSVITRI